MLLIHFCFCFQMVLATMLWCWKGHNDTNIIMLTVTEMSCWSSTSSLSHQNWISGYQLAATFVLGNVGNSITMLILQWCWKWQHITLIIYRSHILNIWTRMLISIVSCTSNVLRDFWEIIHNREIFMKKSLFMHRRVWCNSKVIIIRHI